jgi:hypothetical protein
MTAPDMPPTAAESAAFGVAAHEVWAYRLDFANLPDYNPDVSGVERVSEGEGVGGTSGSGARYRFTLTDPRRPDGGHPVELWTMGVIESELVTAGMKGGGEAYEEFVVSPLGPDRCEATLTLWVTIPDGLPDATVAALAESGRQQIRKELDLMRLVLEERAGSASVH